MSVKTISDLKGKVASFETKHKIVPKVMSAALAMSMVAVPVSAEETTSTTTVDYGSVVDSLKSGLVQVVQNCISLATAMIPLMAGVWGLSVMVGYAKKWFTKISG